MGILLCEQNFRDVWRRNKSVRGEIGKILRTHKHTHAAKLVVRISAKLKFARKVKTYQRVKSTKSKRKREYENLGDPLG